MSQIGRGERVIQMALTCIRSGHRLLFRHATRWTRLPMLIDSASLISLRERLLAGCLGAGVGWVRLVAAPRPRRLWCASAPEAAHGAESASAQTMCRLHFQLSRSVDAQRRVGCAPQLAGVFVPTMHADRLSLPPGSHGTSAGDTVLSLLTASAL